MQSGIYAPVFAGVFVALHRMVWDNYIKGFRSYLQLEKSLSANTIENYERDVEKLKYYIDENAKGIGPEAVTFKHLQGFVKWINELGLAGYSQARIISGVRAFYKYLLMEDIVDNDAASLLESPKLRRKVPDVLNKDEIEKILDIIDVSTPEGYRNKTIIEVLYGCGLRISEAMSLKLTNLYLDVGYIKVIGKGDKERLVPIGGEAIRHITTWRDNYRVHIAPHEGFENFLFLNNRGKALSRVMSFIMIKKYVAAAGINKTVSPHTFRHSFATVLIDGGADLRAVQEMLGHASITTTEIYTHLDRDYLRATLNQYHPLYNPADKK